MTRTALSRIGALCCALAALLLLVASPPAVDAQQTEITDTLLVVKDEEAPTNAELAVRLSESTPLPDTSTVIIGRSDVFADSLASGVLQSASPLLLVPPQGPIPDRVTGELQRLGAERVILLGGTAALGEVVEQELATTYAVERRAGGTRFDTAVGIAATDAPEATTAVLALAFPAPGADETQAFADALSAGGMSAELEAPVLLTNNGSMPPATREYLQSSPIERVLIVGGTAAISQAVEDEIVGMGKATERVSGQSRFETAVEVAEKLEAADAAEVDRVTLVEGQGPDAWAGGFAAAAHSAHFDAPIVLSAGATLPPPTEAFLTANVGGTPTFAVPTTNISTPVLTCVVPISACEQGRVALGLPPSATVTFEPRSASTLTPGQDVTITVAQGGGADGGADGGAGFAQDAEIQIDGTCLEEPTTIPAEEGTTTVTASTDLPEPCTVTVAVPLSNGSVQTTTATYPGGTVEGVVRSATTGEPIPNATVTLSDGSATTSDDAGAFTFTELPGGRYTVVAEAAEFAPADVPVIVEPAVTSTVDVLLSPQLAEGEVRIVLSWGESPDDLDSHLWLPEAQPWHVYYATDGRLEACPFAALDIDDTSSFGPETITISQAYPGTYRYAVRNFSGSPSLSSSGAVVQLFDANGLVREFTVPLNGTEAQDVWHVFDLDVGAGALTPVNRMLADIPEVRPYESGSQSC